MDAHHSWCWDVLTPWHFFSVWHDSRPMIITIDNIYMMCGSRKYPYPTMEDIKSSYGWGGDKCMSKTKKFQRGEEGVMLLLLTVVGCGYFLLPHNGLLSSEERQVQQGVKGKMKERNRDQKGGQIFGIVWNLLLESKITAKKTKLFQTFWSTRVPDPSSLTIQAGIKGNKLTSWKPWDWMTVPRQTKQSRPVVVVHDRLDSDCQQLGSCWYDTKPMSLILEMTERNEEIVHEWWQSHLHSTWGDYFLLVFFSCWSNDRPSLFPYSTISQKQTFSTHQLIEISYYMFPMEIQDNCVTKQFILQSSHSW